MKKKILIAFVVTLCAALLVAGSVFGTLAYLSANQSVINTFTYGSVAITLDEAKVDVNGEYETDEYNRTEGEAGNTYKLIPGKTYIKDPVIRVEAGSEKCYLMLKVDSNLTNVETEEAAQTIRGQMEARDWTYNETYDVYIYDLAVESSNAVQSIPTFTTFTTNTVSKDWSKESNLKITVTAYAVQAEGFNTALEAYEAAFVTTKS